MAERSHDQKIGDVEGSALQAQAGQNAYAVQNSPGAQIIQQSFWSLFGQLPAQPGIDWERAQRILQNQQAEIKNRLRQMLLGEVVADVDLAEEPEWVAKLRSQSLALAAEKTLSSDAVQAETIDPQLPILATYARPDIRGSLLILGTPGAGKTTTLLQLAEQLVGEAIAQPQTVIPIIFELSTWRDDQQSIQDWLIQQLYENFSINPAQDRRQRLYEQWLDKRVLLPLLDGLDELGLVRQQRYTQKINEFAKAYRHLVVCCRVREFALAGVKLSNLGGAVRLQPLSDQQIQEYLAQVGKSALWQQIQAKPEMQRLLEPVLDPENPTAEGDPGLLRVPLFIDLAARVYDPHKPLQGKADLFERYIDRQLSRDVREHDRGRKEWQQRGWAYQTLEQEPEWREVRHSLSWLARQLQCHNQVELLIEHLQPSWLETWQAKRRYRLIVDLISSLVGGLIFGLIFGLIGGLIVSLINVLINGLIFGLIGGLDPIQPVESFKISLSRVARRETFQSLCKWLIDSLIVGLFFSLIGGLIFGLIDDLIGVLINVLIGGLIFGLIFGLILRLKQDLKVRPYPNQGIWNSLQSMIWTTALIYLAGVILVMASLVARQVAEKHDWMDLPGILLQNSPQYLLSGLFGALIFGFWVGGGLACIQHFCLRLVLTQTGKIPWNYARWLNYCAERRLLQRVGGRYHFIHRELLDHFAAMQNSKLNIQN